MFLICRNLPYFKEKMPKIKFEIKICEVFFIFFKKLANLFLICTVYMRKIFFFLSLICAFKQQSTFSEALRQVKMQHAGIGVLQQFGITTPLHSTTGSNGTVRGGIL